MSNLPPGTTHADIDRHFGPPQVCRGCNRQTPEIEDKGHEEGCEFSDPDRPFWWDPQMLVEGY
ncbi:hypothetical protein HUG10_20590 (plasmid) [Halorarum halophilum]|uniref:Uncharacterized protein n=1 Tax=Halorarum halophilum TaxID=2743090 RepID=A0A7D5GPK9_9EURY|nr:hypothetical protein [Halobaculum halophilum]QLG30007.1 hypothetical protein HUG10_20590 [Halobaculum halophilum]